jgi:phosphate transport system permease protein
VRYVINHMALTLASLAMLLGLILMTWILWTILRQSIHALSWELFTQAVPPAGDSGGGLANALLGSIIMVSIATLIGTPLGLAAGIYLAEYGRHTRLASWVEFVNDLLLAGPSIVIGLLIYMLIVLPTGGFSGWAGIIALAVIQVPIVLRTTHNMLLLVPQNLREAAIALGTPRWKMIASITIKASFSGIMTGILLGIARIGGETAPLLFTALGSNFFGTSLSKPMPNLPKMIFDFAMSPYERWQDIAWAGVLILTLGVLMLNILARYINRHSQ